MNKRLRELANEAGLPTHNPEGIPTKLERFAELIVRECLHTMKDGDLDFAIWKIKKDFGVEKNEIS